ncbi:MAG: HAD family phosphatase [Dehalococcoidia bacterium]
MITHVLFDLGGVVCRFDHERRLEAFAAATALPPAEVHARLWDSGFSRECDEGRHDAASMHARANELLGTDLARGDLERLWAAAFEVDPAVLEAVHHLPSHVGRAVLSDNPPLLLDALERWLPDVPRTFAPVLFSHALGATKSAAEAFIEALTHLEAAPANVLFIDDSPANVEAALALGIEALRYTDAPSLRRDLARRGLEEPRL